MSKKRYALVGTGSRAGMFIDALTTTYHDSSKLVALCDLSQIRMNWYNQRIQKRAGLSAVPTYHAEQFDVMLRETHPDVVIVTTVDATHHIYITRAMEQGYDVITEKPMTTDVEKLSAIMHTIDRTGKSLRVTFNARYEPIHTRFRELLLQGVVGKPLAVDFSWMLDVRHGADYFRRWHREKQYSGGLLVHKATHHFDLVNWWIDSYPQAVFAMGALQFYGKKNAEERGERYSYDRYTDVPEATHDPFALSLHAKEENRGLYLAAEEETGYLRDRNVFGEPITIEDTMCVMVRYRNRVLLSYSLVAYSPWEGLHVAITGTKGRLEMDVADTIPDLFSHGETPAAVQKPTPSSKAVRIRVYPTFGTPYDSAVTEGEGEHGGADTVLLSHLFSPHTIEDPLQRAASHIDGAASILVGIAANESIQTGQQMIIDDLFQLPDKGMHKQK
ncbi:Gfo/Idh/MocA family oxidoreductase [Dictyobacter alpinus]|nr:Gfo/Idh/MocA family oxidoreductase [Dictyobacter alpinus]